MENLKLYEEEGKYYGYYFEIKNLCFGEVMKERFNKKEIKKLVEERFKKELKLLNKWKK